MSKKESVDAASMHPIVLPPCPFCGGHAVECFSKTPCRDVSHSWVGGEATAAIGCSSCGIKGKTHRIDCGPRDATDKDVQEAMVHARIYWCARLSDGVLEHCRKTIVKHMNKPQRHDKSHDWHQGFNDACRFLLEEMLIAEGR
jgi:hypothetical protein